MAQSLCNMSNIIPILKSSSNNKYDYFNGNLRSCKVKNGVKAMKAEKRDNLDHLQRPGLKRREVTSVPIGLWDRFPSARTVQQMMDTMDRMGVVEDPSAFGTRWPSPTPNDRSGYARGRTPWDIKEDDDAYKMRFDMPGMTKDDVRIWVEESMLVIKAEKVPRKTDGNDNGGVAENEGDWPAKSYGRYYALPENVEFEKIKAEVRDGVLYLTIPKPSLKSKVFDINVE
ncbi:hypothetical protein RND81_07G200700 [Saponaria officinalis]|uniref:SHSP domain-containing protein n=1 Tax=Saponaria officinalis TaxID=3572 RepID=A0AAW1JV89_SAPOF